VVGLFNDAEEVSNFIGYCDNDTEVPDCPTYIMDLEFNIDEDLINTLIEMVHKELIIFYQSKEDITNDGRDNASKESK